MRYILCFLDRCTENPKMEHQARMALSDAEMSCWDQMVIDHINNRGAGRVPSKTYDLNNMQLLSFQENSDKGSKRYDTRKPLVKYIIDRISHLEES